MHFLEHFNKKTLKYDLVNKFIYKNTKKLPKLKKIILNLECKTAEIKQLSSAVLALELITNQKSFVTLAKRPNILLKIRKGNPNGCKVTLNKFKMFTFFNKSLVEIFPKVKNFNEFNFRQKLIKNIFSYKFYNTFSFTELEQHYYLFNNLPKLNVTMITTSSTKNELFFLLKSLQFPCKKV